MPQMRRSWAWIWPTI